TTNTPGCGPAEVPTGLGVQRMAAVIGGTSVPIAYRSEPVTPVGVEVSFALEPGRGDDRPVGVRSVVADENDPVRRRLCGACGNAAPRPRAVLLPVARRDLLDRGAARAGGQHAGVLRDRLRTGRLRPHAD